MISLKSVPSESPIGWFLEEENSSVGYFTVRDVLDRSERDRDVVTAKKAIAMSPVVRRILQNQKREGSFSLLFSNSPQRRRAGFFSGPRNRY